MRRLAIALLAACAHPAPPQHPTDDVRDSIHRAEDAERARRHDVARTEYQRAVAAAHDSSSIAYARHAFAETLITWGEYAEAMAQLDVAVRADPTAAPAWHDLGMLRYHQGDSSGAIAAFEQARTLAPDDIRPRKELAVLRWKLGDLAGAKAEYRGLLALDLPDRLRDKVTWAIDQLDRQLAQH